MKALDRPNPAPEPLTIALVDSDLAVHAWLRRTLAANDHRFVVKSFPNPQVISPIPSSLATASVVLLDLGMPGLEGIDCIRALRSASPRLPVLAATARLEARQIHSALVAGACGCLVKPLDAAHLVSALNAAKEGLPFMDERALAAMLGAWQATAPSPALTCLSARQNELMSCLLQNLSDKEISDRLGISTLTVNAHLKRIYRKLNVHRRQEAALKMLGIRLM